MTNSKDSRWYKIAYEALTEKGVPISAADKAAIVIANDDKNISRTESDQKDVDDAMTWYRAKQQESK